MRFTQILNLRTQNGKNRQLYLSNHGKNARIQFEKHLRGQ